MTMVIRGVGVGALNDRALDVHGEGRELLV